MPMLMTATARRSAFLARHLTLRYALRLQCEPTPAAPRSNTMTETIELRLSDKQARLAGISKALHQNASLGALERVEVRYTAQVSRDVNLPAVIKMAADVMKEIGLPKVKSISVREHESAIDKALGELVVRLQPMAPGAAMQPPSPWWQAVLRNLPFFRQLVRQPNARLDPTAPAEAPLQNSAPAIDLRLAAKALRDAVANATEFIGPSEAGSAIARATVTVRDAGLHAAYKTLIRDDLAGTAADVRRTLAQLSVSSEPSFAVVYVYQPRNSGDGTRYGSDADVEVELHSHLKTASSGQGSVLPTSGAPTLMPRASSAAPANGASNALADATLLPGAGPALSIRVLGTTAGKFDHAFELRFASLPARFDRAALDRAGFGLQHAQLLRVASNTSPLTVLRNAAGQIALRAGSRAWQEGRSLPMYYDAGSCQPVEGEHPLPAQGWRLLVNSPEGVPEAPGSSRMLPALEIELVPGAND